MQIPSLPLTIILVEPKSPGNIGMVCRAMANFGAVHLRLVNPCQHLHPEAHKFAVFAADLLGKAEIFPDLPAAMADLHIAVAVTRRQGRLRGDPLPTAEMPRLISELPAGGRIGLVFGREDAGLTSAEVGFCTHTSFIPSLPQSGSLNLAQAVLIYLYEFFQATAGPPSLPRQTPELPTLEETAGLFAAMEAVVNRIGFLNAARPEARLLPLRDILRRSGLSREETALLRGLWDQLAWSINDWRGPRRGE